MNQFIFMPTSSASQEPWEIKVDRASRDYSTNTEVSKAFRDGAKWERGDDSGSGILAFVIAILFLLTLLPVCLEYLTAWMVVGP